MAEWLVGSLGLGLFGYNRKNFMFDSEQRVRREFQGQNMRIKRFELYREDVRDLVDLTVSKMDNYLIIGTLLLGFTVRLFYEGRPRADPPHPPSWPPWLIWLWAVANIGAFLYFAVSMWLAMHASIAAHSFSVKMLTQFVRLPVASREEIRAAVSKAEDYEQHKVQDMLRIPVLRQQLRRLNATMANDTASAPEETEASQTGDDVGAADHQEERTVNLEHIVLYRQAQENWQAYDAYARVCMAMGTQQLLLAITYYCMGMLVVEVRSPIAALSCGLVLQASALLIIMLDVYDCEGRHTLRTAVIIFLCHMVCTWLSVIGSILETHWFRVSVSFLVPFTFALHAGWIAFMVNLASPEDSKRAALPAKFRSVLYLDVFGWLPGAGGGGAVLSQETLPWSQRVQHLRASLHESCQRQRDELQQDLALWEGQDVSDELTAERIETLREKYQAAAMDFEGLEPPAAAGAAEAPAEPTAASPALRTWQASPAQQVWLKLEVQTSGGPIDFFLEANTGDVRCCPPEEAGVRILELPSLERQLQLFTERVRTLAKFPHEPREEPLVSDRDEAAAAEMRPGGQDVPGLLQPPMRSGSSSSEISRSTTQSHLQFQPHFLTQSSGGSRGEDAGVAVQLAEEQLSRGRLEEAPALASTSASALASAAAAAAVNEAGQEPRAARVPTSPGLQNVRRPPGHMPWRTFFQGSAVLLSVWLLGAIWSVVLELSGRGRPIDTAAGAPAEPLLLERIETHPRPDPFFSPLSLACHPSLPGRLFVAETYRVHQLFLDAEGVVSWASLALGQIKVAPVRAFMASAGLRGVQLQCGCSSSPGQESDCPCKSLLLSAAGQRALACDVDTLPFNASLHRPRTAPRSCTEWKLHGGPWDALLPNGHSDGNSAELWGRGGDGELVLLQKRLGFQDEFLPRYVLPSWTPERLVHHHLLESGAILGLDASGGRLHSWQGGGGARPISWRLQTADLAIHHWAGLCADRQALYLLGIDSRGTPAIWRTHLPRELRTG